MLKCQFVFGSVNTHKHTWRRRVLKTKNSGQTYPLSLSPVLPKTTCAWWSMEILCIGVNSWREPLWVVCAPSWSDRSRVWSIWNKVTETRGCPAAGGLYRRLCSFVQTYPSDLVFITIENNLLLSLFNSSSASVPFADDWPEHQDPAAVWLPQRRQVQFHQQGKHFSEIIRWQLCTNWRCFIRVCTKSFNRC